MKNLTRKVAFLLCALFFSSAYSMQEISATKRLEAYLKIAAFGGTLVAAGTSLVVYKTWQWIQGDSNNPNDKLLALGGATLVLTGGFIAVDSIDQYFRLKNSLDQDKKRIQLLNTIPNNFAVYQK